MEALALFIEQHAQVHSRSVAPAPGGNLEDIVCQGLTDVQLATAPPGMNSIAWILWHLARYEDVAINVVLRQSAQLLDDGWSDRLGIDTRTAGTGDDPNDLASFNAVIDVSALREYRAAVGRATRAWASELNWAVLEAPVPGGARAHAAGALGEHAAWIERYWDGQPGWWFLTWLSAGHHYWHLGEAEAIARALGRRGA